jgi:hypothetical protein
MNGALRPTSQANTPTIASAATALASNTGRLAFSIQNLGTNALYILLGTGASTSVFHTVLVAGTVNDNGTGGSYSMESGTIYTGIVTVAGTSPRYTVTEL